MKLLNSNEFKSYRVNGFAITALSFREALLYVWMLNNPIKVIAKFSEGRELIMKVQVGYQSQFIEESIAIAVEDRLELIGLSYDSYEVYSIEGAWLSSSEL